MSGERSRRRRGLEGLPVNDGEVFMFDGVRGGLPRREWPLLIFVWVFGAVGAGLAIWEPSLVLGICSALILAFALWMTVSKVRARS
jgi:hypothetical protein